MKFCQADGTPLIDEMPNAGGNDDPFKTVLAEDSTAAEPQFDPMKTMLAPPPSVDLPPPSPFGEPETKFSNEAPSFGDLGAPQFNNAPLPSETASDKYSGGFGQTPSEPFGQPQPPFGGFADAPRTPTFQEPEPPFGQQASYNQPQFGQQPTEWTPPPVPQTGWDNQALGQNTPFSPPPLQAQAQSQVFPIISLVTGIISIFCCWLSPILGTVALVMGYLSLGNIKKNSQLYGGRGLAIAGMVTGGIGLAVGILYYILVVFASLFGR